MGGVAKAGVRVAEGAGMGGRQLGRRRSVVVTVAAVVALVLGSWLVVGSAAGSATAPGTRPASLNRAAGRDLVPSTRGTTSPRTASAEAPSTTLPPSTTAPPSTTPGSTTLPPSATAPTPPTTVAVVPVAGSDPFAAAAKEAVPAPPRASRRHRAGGAMLAPAPQTARAVAQLIGAINGQSGSQGAIPDTADNIGLLGRWMANEGGLWADNPLNTSLDAGSYPHQFTASGQDTGIPIFPDLAAGVAATATTLLSNPSYSRILHVLRSGSASCIAFARVVIQSPWASGHYDHDPVGFCSGSIVPARRGHQRHRGG
ncbi:MAG: hypothetical protein P4L20_14505 [Acidimicrobiales bacterium]|nr:hypothetical protein [Acidimicrobiales bacterium]